MPYKHEHACRIREPGEFTRFVRDNDADPNVILGYRKDGSSDVQAYRYPVERWTKSRARNHCDEHDGTFEPAETPKNQQADYPDPRLKTQPLAKSGNTAHPEWLRVGVSRRPVGVDRTEGYGLIRGMVVAQAGPFKTKGRGEFDEDGLATIAELIRESPNGLKSRLAHPTLSDDGIGKFLGRVRDPWLDTLGDRDSFGGLAVMPVRAVRADLYLDQTSRNTPNGDLGGYVMDLAESDSDALSSSLVLTVEDEYRVDKKGRPAVDDEGNELPPIWRPLRLHASDIVDTGDAVDGLLSIGGLPDEIVRRGAAMLDQQFRGLPADVIRQRAHAWLERYLEYRFGAVDSDPAPHYDPARDRDLRRRQWRRIRNKSRIG